MVYVRAERVSTAYGRGLFRRVQVLQSVDFQLGPGQIHGLLGENGAGKTTLIKTLLGLIRPTDGTIRYGVYGRSVKKRVWLKHVGYVPEQNINIDVTGKRFLSIMAGLSGFRLKNRPSALQELLTLAGLDEHRNKKVRNYSKGMGRRLLLAQALVNRPGLLFLDEPMSGLDPVQRIAVRKLLAGYRRTDAAVLISSHELAAMEEVCTDISLMRDGKIIAAVDTAELSRANSLEELYVSYYQT